MFPWAVNSKQPPTTISFRKMYSVLYTRLVRGLYNLFSKPAAYPKSGNKWFSLAGDFHISLTQRKTPRPSPWIDRRACRARRRLCLIPLPSTPVCPCLPGGLPHDYLPIKPLSGSYQVSSTSKNGSTWQACGEITLCRAVLSVTTWREGAANRVDSFRHPSL